MRIVLRHTETGCYFQAETGSRWTNRQDDAREFALAEEAIELACLERLEGVEVVYCGEDLAQEIRIPFR